MPQVKISTELVKNEIILKIRDNGKGIPQRDLDRLFNPFFTRVGGPNKTHFRRNRLRAVYV
ncbi:ATP-binding protein [Runella sp.]|uniref:ATP-binding protein n=1 Tax=Runella sp. TaxID=1960881 RepID=UPI0038F65B38